MKKHIYFVTGILCIIAVLGCTGKIFQEAGETETLEEVELEENEEIEVDNESDEASDIEWEEWETEIQFIAGFKEEDMRYLGHLPELILKNEDGSYYEPRHVTIEEFYERVKELETKYNNFISYNQRSISKPEWSRDTAVATMLYFNCLYMDEGDVKKIYNDYLGNYGGVSILCFRDLLSLVDTNQNFYPYPVNDRMPIELEDYFFDERLVEEARRMNNWLSVWYDGWNRSDKYTHTVSNDLASYFVSIANSDQKPYVSSLHYLFYDSILWEHVGNSANIYYIIDNNLSGDDWSNNNNDESVGGLVKDLLPEEWKDYSNPAFEIMDELDENYNGPTFHVDEYYNYTSSHVD